MLATESFFKAGDEALRCVHTKSTLADNLPRMDSALGVLLDGAAVKEKAEASGNLLNSKLTFLGSGYYPRPVGVSGCKKAFLAGQSGFVRQGTAAIRVRRAEAQVFGVGGRNAREPGSTEAFRGSSDQRERVLATARQRGLGAAPRRPKIF